MMPETPPQDDRSRLIRVLRSIVERGEAVGCGLAEEKPSVTHYMREQVNHIRAQLARDDALIAELFPPIPEDTSLQDVAAIARQLLECVDGGPTLTERAAKAARHGVNVTGKNVHVVLAGLAELGEQIRERVAAAVGEALRTVEPSTPAEVDARIEELERELKAYADRIGTEDTPGVEETVEFAAKARLLARLKGRKARASGEGSCCGDSPSGETERCCWTDSSPGGGSSCCS